MPSIIFRKPGAKLYPAENYSAKNKNFLAGPENQLQSQHSHINRANTKHVARKKSLGTTKRT